MEGRPRKDNADYFSHDADASSDEKILYLESKFGLAGYAVYFKLLEILTRSPNFEIKFNEITKTVYAKKIGVSAEEFNQIIAECCRVEIKAFVIKNNVLFSPGLKKRLSPLIDKREKMRLKYEETKQKESETIYSEAESRISESETTQSKVKESKVKKSIVTNGRFTPPTEIEISEYLEKLVGDGRKEYKSFDIEKFVNFYQSKNWYVGKNKMKDWKAAVCNAKQWCIDYTKKEGGLYS